MCFLVDLCVSWLAYACCVFPGRPVCVVCFLVDLSVLCSVSQDTTVRLWNIEHTEEIPAVIETRRTQAGGYQIMKVRGGRSCSDVIQNSDTKLPLFLTLSSREEPICVFERGLIAWTEKGQTQTLRYKLT